MTTIQKLCLLMTFSSLCLPLDITGQKIEMSFESPYIDNTNVENLLQFEENAFDIADIWERNQYYRAIAHHLNEEISFLKFRLGTMEYKLKGFIIEYEEKLNKPHYQFSTIMPEFSFLYKPIPLDQVGIEHGIYQKEALTMKSQYLQLYNFYKSQIDQYKDYLFTLREEHFYEDPTVGATVVFYDDEFEEMFYQNVQELLRESILFLGDEQPEFMKVIRDFDNKVISMNWFTYDDSLIRSKDFEYFDSGLLAAVRERVGGRIENEILYGQNQFSKLYYDFVFSSGFLPSNYDHMTEIRYNMDGRVDAYDFLTLNGRKIGSINYIYNNKGNLEKEIWKKGKTEQVIREFTSIFDSENGSYRIIEKDKYGRIIFQDIVHSLEEEKFEKDVR